MSNDRLDIVETVLVLVLCAWMLFVVVAVGVKMVRQWWDERGGGGAAAESQVSLLEANYRQGMYGDELMLD